MTRFSTTTTIVRTAWGWADLSAVILVQKRSTFHAVSPQWTRWICLMNGTAMSVEPRRYTLFLFFVFIEGTPWKEAVFGANDVFGNLSIYVN